jgi:hypothetical protein
MSTLTTPEPGRLLRAPEAVATAERYGNPTGKI